MIVLYEEDPDFQRYALIAHLPANEKTKGIRDINRHLRRDGGEFLAYHFWFIKALFN